MALMSSDRYALYPYPLGGEQPPHGFDEPALAHFCDPGLGLLGECVGRIVGAGGSLTVRPSRVKRISIA